MSEVPLQIISPVARTFHPKATGWSSAVSCQIVKTDLAFDLRLCLSGAVDLDERFGLAAHSVLCMSGGHTVTFTRPMCTLFSRSHAQCLHCSEVHTSDRYTFLNLPCPVGTHRIVKRFRRGLVCKAHRLWYHSTLGSRLIKKKTQVGTRSRPAQTQPLLDGRGRTGYYCASNDS